MGGSKGIFIRRAISGLHLINTVQNLKRRQFTSQMMQSRNIVKTTGNMNKAIKFHMNNSSNTFRKHIMVSTASIRTSTRKFDKSVFSSSNPATISLTPKEDKTISRSLDLIS